MLAKIKKDGDYILDAPRNKAGQKMGKSGFGYKQDKYPKSDLTGGQPVDERKPINTIATPDLTRS